MGWHHNKPAGRRQAGTPAAPALAARWAAHPCPCRARTPTRCSCPALGEGVKARHVGGGAGRRGAPPPALSQGTGSREARSQTRPPAARRPAAPPAPQSAGCPRPLGTRRQPGPGSAPPPAQRPGQRREGGRGVGAAAGRRRRPRRARRLLTHDGLAVLGAHPDAHGVWGAARVGKLHAREALSRRRPSGRGQQQHAQSLGAHAEAWRALDGVMGSLSSGPRLGLPLKAGTLPPPPPRQRRPSHL